MSTIEKFFSSDVDAFRNQGKRSAIFGWGGDDDTEYEEERDTTKSEEEIAFIDEVCKSRIIFHGLDEEQRFAIINQMYKVYCPKGRKIIVQGDLKAEEFYVVNDGKFDILVNGLKVVSCTKGDGFGELALLHNAPRSATVVASENSTIFAVNRVAFRTVVRRNVRERGRQIQAMLKAIPEFSGLSDKNIALIQMAFVEYLFQKDEVILRQGEDGDRFYIIISGACTWQKELPTGELENGHIGIGEYFGERALITREKRSATIIAETPVKTFTLSKEDFHELIGDGRSFLKRMTSYDSSEHQSLQHSPRRIECNLQDLLDNTVGVLGIGAFGIVTLVVDKKRGISYALKAIKKCEVVRNHQQKHIITEMRVMRALAQFNCRFLANMFATYKDSQRVYFLLEACLGGELFTILRRQRTFKEPTARFYTACVVEAFHCMHSHNIIYRDLKPENLVLDRSGFAKVTDFGFAKVVTGRTFTLCGTPDYLAPELVSGQGHGRAADWWTLGILTYEMLASIPPFYSDNPIKTYRKIVKGKPKLPSSFSNNAKRFVSSLLKMRPVKRLGMQCGGTNIVRKHSFFDNFNWKSLQNQTMKAPIQNKVRNIKDLRNFEKIALEDDEAESVRKEDDFDDEF